MVMMLMIIMVIMIISVGESFSGDALANLRAPHRAQKALMHSETAAARFATREELAASDTNAAAPWLSLLAAVVVPTSPGAAETACPDIVELTDVVELAAPVNEARAQLVCTLPPLMLPEPPRPPMHMTSASPAAEDFVIGPNDHVKSLDITQHWLSDPQNRLRKLQ